jgi:hypothetical protein
MKFTPLSLSKQEQQLENHDLSSILKKTDRNSFAAGDISKFERSVTPLYTPYVVHATFSFETNPAARKMRSFVHFDENCL